MDYIEYSRIATRKPQHLFKRKFLVLNTTELQIKIKKIQSRNTIILF